jgi:hypothetical protein
MNHRTATHHDHMDTTTYRQAWEEWLKKQDFGLFVTLKRDTTPAENYNAIKACNVHTFPHIPSSLPDFSLQQPSSATFHELIVYRTHSVMV